MGLSVRQPARAAKGGNLRLMSDVDPFDELVQRLETARARLDSVDTPDAAVEALEELQETARQISTEIDRRRRALSDERGDGQFDLL